MALADLNQLRTFVTLYEVRSVTAAADRLHVTQPTVSYTLRRLRERFGDELFRREGHDMVPTAKATALFTPLHEALAQIDATVSDPEAFEPSGFSGELALGLTSIGEQTFLPPIMAALAREASSPHLLVERLDSDQVEDGLIRGTIDLAMTVSMIGSPRLWRTHVRAVEYVALTAAAHPLPPTAPDMFVDRHFVRVSARGGHVFPLQVLTEHGLMPQVALTVEEYSTVPAVVQARISSCWSRGTLRRCSAGGSKGCGSPTCRGRRSRRRCRCTRAARRAWHRCRGGSARWCSTQWRPGSTGTRRNSDADASVGDRIRDVDEILRPFLTQLTREPRDGKSHAQPNALAAELSDRDRQRRDARFALLEVPGDPRCAHVVELLVEHCEVDLGVRPARAREHRRIAGVDLLVGEVGEERFTPGRDMRRQPYADAQPEPQDVRARLDPIHVQDSRTEERGDVHGLSGSRESSSSAGRSRSVS